ncbi:MAG: hypothetical protein DCF25_05425 [Leptolyngbya foveolarum]|uniref:Uncharacterized protein n=1 Tax=Leptolyngbya foveolarum TaxID=47253 RepID=A0A2W4UIP4_9CYAN|nr:MAG: hypothetical protein DCF25_05425 [Leptolyngbya foveolarum]
MATLSIFVDESCACTGSARSTASDRSWGDRPKIYEQLPALPLENQYSSKTGQVAEDNTLVARIIRYHLYSKERPTNFRLEWKLSHPLAPDESPD